MARYRYLEDYAPWVTPQRLGAPADEPAQPKPSQFRSHGTGSPVDEDGLAAELARLMRDSADVSPARSDAAFAIALRKLLPLTRREAADQRLWSWLNLGPGWAYVVWRWGGNGSVTVGRARGALARSALGRLWWMAELATGRGTDAASTDKEQGARIEKLLANQDRAVQVYERPRLFVRPRLGPELVEEAGKDSWGEDQFRTFARSCAGYFGTRLTGAMSVSSVSAAVTRQAKGAQSETE